MAAAAEEKETHAFEVDPAQVIYKSFLKLNTSYTIYDLCCLVRPKLLRLEQ